VRADDHQDQGTAGLERMRRELAAGKALGCPGPALVMIMGSVEAVTSALARGLEYVRPADPEVGFQWLS
jgi:hypothetical protein